VSDATNLLAEAERLRPQVVLLDIEMPGPDAFEAADLLHRAHPDMRLLVLSAHARDSFVSAAFASGACGYFAKSDGVEELIEGIREAVRSPDGSFLLGPTLRDRFQVPSRHRKSRTGDADAARTGPTPVAHLSAREFEVLRLIGKGLGRSDIARQLCRSVKTIDGHQDRLMKKLGLHARADLMRFAIREGIAQA
jgi:two-component system response regulator NreC